MEYLANFFSQFFFVVRYQRSSVSDDDRYQRFADTTEGLNERLAGLRTATSSSESRASSTSSDDETTLFLQARAYFAASSTPDAPAPPSDSIPALPSGPLSCPLSGPPSAPLWSVTTQSESASAHGQDPCNGDPRGDSARLNSDARVDSGAPRNAGALHTVGDWQRRRAPSLSDTVTDSLAESHVDPVPHSLRAVRTQAAAGRLDADGDLSIGSRLQRDPVPDGLLEASPSRRMIRAVRYASGLTSAPLAQSGGPSTGCEPHTIATRAYPGYWTGRDHESTSGVSRSVRRDSCAYRPTCACQNLPCLSYCTAPSYIAKAFTPKPCTSTGKCHL